MKRMLTTATLLLTTLIVPATLAFNPSGSRWEAGRTLMFTGLSGAADDGTSWQSVLESAMSSWNVSSFRFLSDKRYRDPCAGYRRSASGSDFPAGNGDEANGIGFAATVCGNDFGSGVLAITLNYSLPRDGALDPMSESDIIFNNRYSWDLYTGNAGSRHDFSRVALHELGHVLGLNHEATNPSIMSAKVGNIDFLTADDIAGANAIYSAPRSCEFKPLTINSVTRGSLFGDDCRMLDLFNENSDTSLVDVYSLTISDDKPVQFHMRSKTVDSVIVLTDTSLNTLDVFDDSNGSCDASGTLHLAPGNYLLLANTYDKPYKCGSNFGDYALTVSNAQFPLLGDAGVINAGTAVEAWFEGGATEAGSSTFQTVFAATTALDVRGQIHLPADQAGLPGYVFVVVVLSDGRRYQQRRDGRFVPFVGIAGIEPAMSIASLPDTLLVPVVAGLKGKGAGISGQQVAVYLGYSLQASPLDIHYATLPITFSVLNAE